MSTVGGIVVSTGIDVGGRRTLKDVMDELSRPVDVNDATVRGLAADAFRAAVRKMNRRGLWPWEIQTEDLTLTAGQRYSAVTGQIKKPLSMHYTAAAGGLETQRIGYMSYDRFREKYNIDLNGQSYIYTVENPFASRRVMWFPIPSGNATARFVYYRTTPSPVREEESVEIPESAVEAYMSDAWYELLKRLPTQQQPFPIAVAMADAQRAFKELSAHVASPGDRSRELDVIHG